MSLFPTHPAFEVGDPLGRCYTTDALADRCLGALVREGCDPHLYDTALAVEPSVGGGAFVRVGRRRWPGLWWLGVDVDPTAPGLQADVCHAAELGDWPVLARNLDSVPLIVVGNPPFDDPLGGAPDRAKHHVQAALDTAAHWVGMILPLEYLCTTGWQPLMARATAVYPIPGRPWSKVRGTAFYVWRPRRGPPADTRLRRLT